MNQKKIKIFWNMPLHRYAESFEYDIEINILRNDIVSFWKICCLRIGSQIELGTVSMTFNLNKENSGSGRVKEVLDLK
jgi:hypothetical protein